jgi:hypothetical protein
MPEVATRTTETLLAADGVDRHGNSNIEESSALTDVLNAATVFLRQVEPAEPTDTLAYSLQSVLAAEDPRFAPEGGSGPIYAVSYDKRGLPRVAKNADGVVVPFRDADGDGLADVDASGRWILSTGESRLVPPFQTRTDSSALLNRDPYGRAMVGNSGDFSFEYIDLSQTGIHFLVRQFDGLAQRGVLWNLVDAAPALLGPREVKTDENGTYSGYSSDNPINDVFYALLHILDIESLDEVLAATADFIAANGDALAGVVYALDEAAEIMGRYPKAGMNDNQTLAYDLLPVLEEISADPELWRDVFWALRQPITRRTGEPMTTMLSYKDQSPATPELGGPYDSCYQACKRNYPLFDEFSETNPRSCKSRYNSQTALQRYACIRECPNDEIFSVPMDFKSPESKSNRSMFQRLFHLLRDTSGTPYALKMVEPESLRNMPAVVELPGSAEVFLRSVGGSMDMADYVPDMGELQPLLDMLGGPDTIANLLSQISPIFGVALSRRATPDEITRMFNKEELAADIGDMGTARISSPVCKDGYVMANHHADMLYGAEASGMIDTITPLACAFSMHDQTDLMTRIFVVAHNHYSSQTDLYQTAEGATSPMKGSNFRSLEPALLEILEKGTLFKALYDMSVAAARVETATGVDFIEQLRVLVHNAVRTDDGFRGRNGEEFINLADGRTLRELSRLHILLQGIDQMSARVEGDPEAEAALDDIFAALADVLLATEWPESAPAAKFSDPGTVALLERATRHLAEKAGELRSEGRLSDWLTEEQMANVASIWDSRALPALVDLSGELARTSEDRELVDDLLDYLLGEPAGRDQAAMGLYVMLVYTLHQDTWVPVSHFLADVLDPRRAWEVEPYAKLPLASHALQVLHDTVEKDPEGRGLELFERGFSNREDGTVPFATIFEIIADYFRPNPTSRAPYTPEDYRVVIGEFAHWLGDDRHGIEQLYDIVSPRESSP